jgi:hypothetical protein
MTAPRASATAGQTKEIQDLARRRADEAPVHHPATRITGSTSQSRQDGLRSGRLDMTSSHRHLDDLDDHEHERDEQVPAQRDEAHLALAAHHRALEA